MPELAGMINVYACPQGHKTTTINVDEGTTPFIIGCRHLDEAGKKCGVMAHSQFYRVPQAGQENSPTPTHEWFKAESSAGMNQAQRQHWEQGGLDLRPIANPLKS